MNTIVDQSIASELPATEIAPELRPLTMLELGLVGGGADPINTY